MSQKTSPFSQLGAGYSRHRCLCRYLLTLDSRFVLGSSSLAFAAYLEDQEGVDFGLQGSTGNVPNPFCGFGGGVESTCTGSGDDDDYSMLYLVDGGADNQTIPFLPLLQPDRKLDVIIAVDSSADTDWDWPFGGALSTTNQYARSERGQKMNIAFPNSTTTAEFISAHPQVMYTPTFFGCKPEDSTLESPDQHAPPPLIVYLPNAPYTVYPNASTPSTGACTWGSGTQKALVHNGERLAMAGDPYSKLDWGACLACAVADRALARNGLDRSPDCSKCFDYYCAESKPMPPVSLFEGTEYSPPPLEGAVQGDGTYNFTVKWCLSEQP